MYFGYMGLFCLVCLFVYLFLNGSYFNFLNLLYNGWFLMRSLINFFDGFDIVDYYGLMVFFF